MRASLAASILPPDTTQATVPEPARPESAAATAAAPAPSATTRLRAKSRRMASATSARVTTSEPSSSRATIGHIGASRLLPPMPSTKLARCSIARGSPAASEAESGAAVSTSQAKTRVPGFRARTAEAMPLDSPPPP